MKFCVAATIILLCLGCDRDGTEKTMHALKDIPLPAQVELSVTVSGCPKGTVEVDGDYCTVVEQTCLRWVDQKGDDIVSPKPGTTGRCGEFKKPAKCVGRKIKKRFCIDRYEYPNVEGKRPRSWMTWYDVKAACAAQGKRLCTHAEWTMACEGPEMHPYPYGDGYHRDRTSCNTDNAVPKGVVVIKVTKPESKDGQALDSLLSNSGVKSACASPYGVFDMVGNIDEWVVNESGFPYQSGLVGGHVFGVRNACRPMTESHYEHFSWYETGGRCCQTPTD